MLALSQKAQSHIERRRHQPVADQPQARGAPATTTMTVDRQQEGQQAPAEPAAEVQRSQAWPEC